MAIGESDYLKLIAAYSGLGLSDLGEGVTELWCADYRQTHGSADIVSVSLNEHGAAFTYLFDTARSRVVGAYGMPIYYQGKRDSSRQGGAPLGSKDKKKYVRGHLMAHVFGGGMDINFVPQLRSTNGSAFKRVENEVRTLAQQNDRCLYFVRTVYPAESAGQALAKASQLPSKLEQGIVRHTRQLTYKMHQNV